MSVTDISARKKKLPANHSRRVCIDVKSPRCDSHQCLTRVDLTRFVFLGLASREGSQQMLRRCTLSCLYAPEFPRPPLPTRPVMRTAAAPELYKSIHFAALSLYGLEFEIRRLVARSCSSICFCCQSVRDGKEGGERDRQSVKNDSLTIHSFEFMVECFTQVLMLSPLLKLRLNCGTIISFLSYIPYIFLKKCASIKFETFFKQKSEKFEIKQTNVHIKP
jgi:hypothetical protein